MTELPDPVTLIVLLSGLALVPFIAIMVSSFVKLVVVLSLVRNALGVQQAPPNMALNGLAIILSVYIMAPVFYEAADRLEGQAINLEDSAQLIDTLELAEQPFRDFLLKHSHEDERAFFISAAHELWPPKQAEAVTERDFLVLVPAFTASELTSAFQIGFLLYLPFIAIDLIVSNILLAMGMMMVSPMTISLPFKLFLFVMVNGWERLIHGLILTYA